MYLSPEISVFNNIFVSIMLINNARHYNVRGPGCILKGSRQDVKLQEYWPLGYTKGRYPKVSFWFKGQTFLVSHEVAVVVRRGM
jgi:hypothetical protein